MVHGLDHLLDLITEDEVMEACWLNGVVPRVRDPEAMVQKKALEVIYFFTSTNCLKEITADKILLNILCKI